MGSPLLVGELRFLFLSSLASAPFILTLALPSSTQVKQLKAMRVLLAALFIHLAYGAGIKALQVA